MKTNCGVYKITNLIPNEITGICKIYIGSSQNIKSRKYEHFNRLTNNKHVNRYLQNAIKKYGIENFKFELITPVEKIEDKSTLKERLLEEEQKEINKYKNEDGNIDHERCYNILPTAGSRLGSICSEETKKKMKYKAIGFSIQARKAALDFNKGREKLKETKEKISRALEGRTFSEETINKRKESRKCFKHSEETKEKLRKKRKLQIFSEESLNKRKESLSKYKKKVINLDTNETFNSIKEASNFYDIDKSSICNVCKGKQNKAGGYRWSYLEHYIGEENNEIQ